MAKNPIVAQSTRLDVAAVLIGHQMYCSIPKMLDLRSEEDAAAQERGTGQ